MGNMKQMLREGGFSSYLYDDHPDYAPATINGITAKVVYKVDDPTKAQAGLPSYSDTSDMYFKQGIEANIIQAKLKVSHVRLRGGVASSVAYQDTALQIMACDS